MFHVEHGPPPVQTPAQLTCSHPRSPWLPTALASDSWRDILNLTDQPSGSPCWKDVIAARAAEGIGHSLRPCRRRVGAGRSCATSRLGPRRRHGQCPPPPRRRPGPAGQRRRRGSRERERGATAGPHRHPVVARSHADPLRPARRDYVLVAVEQWPSIAPVLTTGHETAVVPPWCLGVASDIGDVQAEADQARVGSIHIHPDGIAIALRVTAAVVTSSPPKGGSAERVRTRGRIASSGVGWSLSHLGRHSHEKCSKVRRRRQGLRVRAWHGSQPPSPCEEESKRRRHFRESCSNSRQDGASLDIHSRCSG